jgi:multisubunit Na+/H+ antiporter MnhG subunit
MGARIAVFLALIVPIAALAGIAAVGGMVAILRNFGDLVRSMAEAGVPESAGVVLLAIAVFALFVVGLGGVSWLIYISWRRLFARFIDQADTAGGGAG